MPNTANGIMQIAADDVRLCNCAHCGQELLGVSMIRLIDLHGRAILPRRYRQTAELNRRIGGRPYCRACAAQEMGEDRE